MGIERRLDQGLLSSDEIAKLETLSKKIRGNIIEMITLANSGHIGGALGSVETRLLTYYGAKIDPNDPFNLDNDVIIESAGHYSAGAYATLAALGFFPEQDLTHFRQKDSPYEGHVTHKVPGIWWDTGILGQGLSAGTAFSLAQELLGHEDTHIFVLMGDGEQNKGQIIEAARFIPARGLRNITAIIDANNQQLSGPTEYIMPMNISALYKSAGWEVIHIKNPYNITSAWSSLQIGRQRSPTAVIAHTVMGKGIPQIEGDFNYHGKTLPKTQAVSALEHLGLENRFEQLEALRKGPTPTPAERPILIPNINKSKINIYTEPMTCRDAWGRALLNLGKANLQKNGRPKPGCSPVAVIDCDLMSSVKTKKYQDEFPSNFFQVGISEHNAGTLAGAMSVTGVLTFLADFGVLSIDEMFQQHRLTALNNGNLKLISTHCGLDVGKDGKTHQALDYLVLSSHPYWRTFVPADANQTDHIVRYMASNYGCMHLATGRSTLPVITKQNSDEPYFDKSYNFTPGEIDIVRDYGDNVVIFTYGSMSHRAVKIAEKMNNQEINIKVINMPTPVSPSQESIREAITSQTNLIISYEDHYIGPLNNEHSGIAPIIKSSLYGYPYQPEIISLGVRSYGQSGKPNELYKLSNLHEDQLTELIQNRLEKLITSRIF